MSRAETSLRWFRPRTLAGFGLALMLGSLSSCGGEPPGSDDPGKTGSESTAEGKDLVRKCWFWSVYEGACPSTDEAPQQWSCTEHENPYSEVGSWEAGPYEESDKCCYDVVLSRECPSVEGGGEGPI